MRDCPWPADVCVCSLVNTLFDVLVSLLQSWQDVSDESVCE